MLSIHSQLSELSELSRWTEEAVAERLSEALSVSLALPGHDCWPRMVRAVWPEMPDTRQDYRLRAGVRRAPPSPQMIARMGEVLPDWLARLANPLHRRVLLLRRTVDQRGRRMSLRRCAELLDVSHEQVRLLERAALSALVANLNGLCARNGR